MRQQGISQGRTQVAEIDGNVIQHSVSILAKSIDGMDYRVSVPKSIDGVGYH